MPTARELLEQADALMRRNRANTLDDIPVLTDVMPAAVFTHAPRTAPPPVDPGPPSVPLLTENIDVIDEDAALGPEAIEGEPSVWLEFEDENHSVIGDAPDSIAIVPPVEMRGVPPDEALLASAEHEEIEFTLPAEEMPAGQVIHDIAALDAADAIEDGAADVFAADAAATVEAKAAAAIEADVHSAAGADFNMADETDIHTADESAVDATDETDVDAADETDVEATEAAGLDAADAGRAIQEAYAAAPIEPTPAAMTFAPVAAATAAAAVAAAPPSMADDDERWVAAAEEIRMQVLQRIDLFTDTGLRDQLTQRLQPIADRASADFVKAINLHVGDLLRTYVAEAIEREIERWRRDH